MIIHSQSETFLQTNDNGMQSCTLEPNIQQAEHYVNSRDQIWEKGIKKRLVPCLRFHPKSILILNTNFIPEQKENKVNKERMGKYSHGLEQEAWESTRASSTYIWSQFLYLMIQYQNKAGLRVAYPLIIQEKFLDTKSRDLTFPPLSVKRLHLISLFLPQLRQIDRDRVFHNSIKIFRDNIRKSRKILVIMRYTGPLDKYDYI